MYILLSSSTVFSQSYKLRSPHDSWQAFKDKWNENKVMVATTPADWASATHHLWVWQGLCWWKRGQRNERALNHAIMGSGEWKCKAQGPVCRACFQAQLVAHWNIEASGSTKQDLDWKPQRPEQANKPQPVADLDKCPWTCLLSPKRVISISQEEVLGAPWKPQGVQGLVPKEKVWLHGRKLFRTLGWQSNKLNSESLGFRLYASLGVDYVGAKMSKESVPWGSLLQVEYT